MVVRSALAAWILVKRRLREPLAPGSGLTHEIQALSLRAVPDYHYHPDGLDLGVFLRPGDEVVGILPAPPGSYCVKCFPWGREVGFAEFLGYEFPGADAPDWRRLCEELDREQQAPEQ